MVSFVIISIESFLPNSDCGLDRHGILGIKSCIGEVLVKVIHGRYHSGNVGCTMQEEEGGVLEDLSDQAWSRIK